jgi:hypothetical protein
MDTSSEDEVGINIGAIKYILILSQENLAL